MFGKWSDPGVLLLIGGMMSPHLMCWAFNVGFQIGPVLFVVSADGS